jgi:hypothetical protein
MVDASTHPHRSHNLFHDFMCHLQALFTCAMSAPPVVWPHVQQHAVGTKHAARAADSA